MRFTKIALLFIASMAISSSTLGQGKQLKKAELAYDQYEFHKAIELFKRAYYKVI